MPNIEAYLPLGALTEDAEKALISKLTDIVLRHEGADPANQIVRDIAWVSVFRPEMYVAGAPADAPRYRIVAAAPEGQFTPERRSALVQEVTEAVLDAEDGAYPRDTTRVWVFTPTIAEGTWGAAGMIWHLADLMTLTVGDAEAGQKIAAKALARARAAQQ